MLYRPNELARIHRYIQNHPNHKYIATGDSDQNKPFGQSMNNIKDMTQYVNDCINIIFPAQIYLKVNKRLKTQDDRNKLVGLKTDVFDKTISVIDICKKYNISTETDFNNVKTKNNITYFNDYAKKVNKHIHGLYGKQTKHTIEVNGIGYYPGLELVCEKHYQNKGFRLFVNYTYVIKSVNKSECVIVEPNEDVYITLKTENLTTLFRLPYANTCHSVQGLSITNKITIFNANIEQFADRNWFWTAITRATELDNITVFIHSDEEIQNMADKRKMMKYFRQKVSGYIDQDSNKGRLIKSRSYITAEWIMSKYEQTKECPGCHNPYEFTFSYNSVKSNLSVDRINNKLAHHRDNCELLCVQCNCAKH